MNTSATIVFLKKYFPHLFMLTMLAACATPPDYPVEPVIEFIRVSKDTMQRSSFFEDTTYVTISFTDGDGDIGSEENTVGINYEDSRYDSFHQELGVPFVPELGASNGLKGQITFRVFTDCCVFPPELSLDPCNDTYSLMPYDQLTLDIYIEDRAGNKSNTVTSTPIYIRCFE